MAVAHMHISPPVGWTMTQLNGNFFFTKDGDTTLGAVGTESFAEGLFGAFSVSRTVAGKKAPTQIIEDLFRRRLGTAPLVRKSGTVCSRQSTLVEWTDGISKVRSWLFVEEDGSVIELAHSANCLKHDESAAAQDEIERAGKFIANQL